MGWGEEGIGCVSILIFVPKMVRRVRGAKVPDAGYDLYSDLVPWFSSQVMETPVRDLPESKRSFLPSLDEKRKVGRMVHAIKMGWMKTRLVGVLFLDTFF